MESCCIYICSVGPIEDCCVMLLLRFPPARKCLVGTFESFLCGFGELCSNLHRSDSEGVTTRHPLFQCEASQHSPPPHFSVKPRHTCDPLVSVRNRTDSTPRICTRSPLFH